jgi:hypothetical protein
MLWLGQLACLKGPLKLIKAAFRRPPLSSCNDSLTKNTALLCYSCAISFVIFISVDMT